MATTTGPVPPSLLSAAGGEQPHQFGHHVGLGRVVDEGALAATLYEIRAAQQGRQNDSIVSDNADRMNAATPGESREPQKMPNKQSGQ